MLKVLKVGDLQVTCIWGGGEHEKALHTHLFTRGNLDKSQYLIDALAELNLHMTLPKDTPILWALLSGNYMRLDNVFISSVMSRNICITNANGFQLVPKLGASRHPSLPTGPVIGPNPNIRFYQTLTLLPLIVIISHCLISSNPVLTIHVYTLDSSLLHPHYVQLLVLVYK